MQQPKTLSLKLGGAPTIESARSEAAIVQPPPLIEFFTGMVGLSSKIVALIGGIYLATYLPVIMAGVKMMSTGMSQAGPQTAPAVPARQPLNQGARPCNWGNS
jgi:hypothetical protein